MRTSLLTILQRPTLTEECMRTSYERRLVLSYLINHRATPSSRHPEMKALVEWASENSALLRPRGRSSGAAKRGHDAGSQRAVSRRTNRTRLRSPGS